MVTLMIILFATVLVNGTLIFMAVNNPQKDIYMLVDKKTNETITIGTFAALTKIKNSNPDKYEIF